MMRQQEQQEVQPPKRQALFQRKLSSEGDLGHLLVNNKKWAADSVLSNPSFFKELSGIQKPQYLWIGCADSRVPANQIVGLKPGQLFVHRNVANVVSPSDINCISVIHYAVSNLKVRHIIVTGHYNCGGVLASLKKQDHGPLQYWLSHIRKVRNDNRQQLRDCQNFKQRLVELNVIQQVRNVGKISSVQAAWKNRQPLSVHGLVYSLKNGLLKVVTQSLRSLDDIPEAARIY